MFYKALVCLGMQIPNRGLAGIIWRHGQKNARVPPYFDVGVCVWKKKKNVLVLPVTFAGAIWCRSTLAVERCTFVERAEPSLSVVSFKLFKLSNFQTLVVFSNFSNFQTFKHSMFEFWAASKFEALFKLWKFESLKRIKFESLKVWNI